jgi:hypothetical protein
MIKTHKDYIPLDVKNRVWNKYSIYPLNKEITQCRTCMNLVLIPESIRHLNGVSYDIKLVYINGQKKDISGVGEYGHIISENNGGKVREDNLVIQCKFCNTRLGPRNIEKSHFIDDCEMIDAEYEKDMNSEMGENSLICEGNCNSGETCKNKTIFNRRYCHIHLKN